MFEIYFLNTRVLLKSLSWATQVNQQLLLPLISLKNEKTSLVISENKPICTGLQQNFGTSILEIYVKFWGTSVIWSLVPEHVQKWSSSLNLWKRKKRLKAITSQKVTYAQINDFTVSTLENQLIFEPEIDQFPFWSWEVVNESAIWSFLLDCPKWWM